MARKPTKKRAAGPAKTPSGSPSAKPPAKASGGRDGRSRKRAGETAGARAAAETPSAAAAGETAGAASASWEPPDWLPQLAAEKWREVVPQLLAAECVTELDRDRVEAYCLLYARWRAAEGFVAEYGSVVTIRSDKGVVKDTRPVPEFGIAKACLVEMRQLACLLGLAPLARKRITGGGDGDPAADELTAFLDGAPG